MKWIRSRTAKKKWQHHFSHYKSMGIFFRRSRVSNSAVSSRIWPNFELLRALMHVTIICKYEKDRIKTDEKKWKHHFFLHYNLSVAMETSSRNWPNFKFMQALMYVIVTCKYKMDPIKKKREKEATPFFPYKMNIWKAQGVPQ